MLEELLLSGLRVCLSRILWLDAEVEQVLVHRVPHLRHHAHLALEGRVEEVVGARDLGSGELGVVPDPGHAGLPREAVAVAGVVGAVLVDLTRVL